MHPHHTVLEGETHAIYTALLYLTKAELHTLPTQIYTDSKFALSTIQHNTKSHHARKVTDLLRSNITLHWTPSHTNVPGNILTDSIARHTAQNETLTITDIGQSTRKLCKQYLNKKKMALWQQQWENSEDGRFTYNIHNTVTKEKLYETHRQNQMATGHFYCQAYAYRFHISDDDTCTECYTTEDIEHILLHCTKHTHTRTKYNITGNLKETLKNKDFLHSLNFNND
jgi:hypothetical protein